MTIIAEKSTVDNNQIATSPEPQGCKLGRELGNCPLRRKGCGSLYDALMYVMPPGQLRAHIAAEMGDDPEARRWLQRLDDVLPEQKPIFARRGW